MIHPLKRLLAGLLWTPRLSPLLLAALGRRYIRAVNYHGTPGASAETLARQFAFYRRHFVDADAEALHGLLAHGAWPYRKPGLIVSFDDGLRSNFETAAPLLERYGFTGWFFVPTAFVDTPPADQAAYARDRLIGIDPLPADGRPALSWDEVRALDTRHVVGSHTCSHARMHGALSAETIRREIVASRTRLAEKLGHEVDSFCWVGGEEANYRREAAEAIREAGYRFAFLTNSAPITARTPPHALQRTNIGADWPLSAVAFQLCGWMDLLYLRKRRRVNRLLQPR